MANRVPRDRSSRKRRLRKEVRRFGAIAQEAANEEFFAARGTFFAAVTRRGEAPEEVARAISPTTRCPR
jgi:hypothetical protein